MRKNITTILCALPVAMMLTSCGGDGDNTLSNWFLAIVLILAALKKSA